MTFKDFNKLDENIIAVLNPLIGNSGRNQPFTANDMVKALTDAKLSGKPETIKKAIDMLDTLISYVTTLSNGKSKSTIDGIEKIKLSMIAALKKISEGQDDEQVCI